jgi:YVTN family beta-propeller protein
VVAPNLPTGTLTMLFTDIEGSTRLLQQLGTQAFTELVVAHRDALRAAFSEHGGQEIGTEGDSFFVVFRRAGDAVAAAVEAQRRLLELKAPDGAVVRVRMGMHTGEPAVSAEGYHGLGVHRAARISSLGHGGQILLSGTTGAVVAEELDGALALRDLGEHRLKDFEQPEHVFEVRYPGAPEASPPLKSVAAQKADLPFARRLARSRPRPGVLVAMAAAALLAVAAIVFALGHDTGPDRITADSVAVLTADGLELAAAIPMRAPPGEIAVGEGSIWVSNADEGTVSRIDAKSRTVVQTIDVGNGPAGIAVGSGFVWVANSLDGTVSRIDPRQRGGRAQQTIRVGNQPVGVAAGEGAVWVANTADKTLSRIDPETGRPGRPISAVDGADVLAVGRSGVWVASRATDTVTQLDPRTGGEIQRFNVGHGPSALAVTDDAAWVTTEFDGTLYRLDPERGGARSTPVGASPRGVAAGTRTVRVTHADGVLTEVAALTVDVERRVRLGGRLGGLAASGGDVFVSVRESGAAHRGGTLELVGDKHGTDSADPAVAYTTITWQLALVTGDGLVGYRRTGGTAGYELVPDLAERLPAVSDGGRTLAFRLRSGVRYSNGEPVRASDVRRGLERSFDLQSPVLQYFGAITGASACTRRKGPCDLAKGIVVDDRARTLNLHLARRDPDILHKLTLSAAYAVPASAPRREVRAGLPATGPYRYARFDPKREVLLVRNPHFREWSAAAQPAGYPDRIHVRLGLSPAAQVAAIRDGRADLAGDNFIFGDARVRRLSVAYASRLRARPYNAHDWAFLDTRSAPFSDERARRAVNLAVDRSVFAGAANARPTCQVLPTNSIGYRSYCPSGIRGDLPRARRLVAQSGTRGARVRVWLTGDRAVGDARMRVVLTALERLGYRTEVRTFENYGAYFTALAAGGRPQVGYFPWYVDYQAPSAIVEPQLSCGGEVNYGRFCDRRIDALAARAAARQTDDPRAAYELWAEVDRRLTDAAAVVPLTSGIEVAFVSERVRNVNAGGLSQVWVR